MCISTQVLEDESTTKEKLHVISLVHLQLPVSEKLLTSTS